jgi:hypothetical protein
MEHGSFVWCHGTTRTTYLPPTINTLHNVIHHNDLWAIRSLHCSANGAIIAQAIICGTAIAVCDGSYKDQFGTAGFVLQCKNHSDLRVTGAIPISIPIALSSEVFLPLSY